VSFTYGGKRGRQDWMKACDSEIKSSVVGGFLILSFCCCCSIWTQGKSINEIVIVESQWAFSCRLNARRIPFELDELSAESIETTFLKPLGPDYSKWECEEVRNFREVLNLSCSRGSLFTPVAFRIRDRHRSVRCTISSGYGQSFLPSRNRRESLSRRVQRRETKTKHWMF